MSLTDREKQMLRAYLPHRRDESLELGEYYWLDNSNRVQKVFIQNILPHDNYTLYSIRYSATGKNAHISDDWYDDGVAKSQLYDNKKDCRESTHRICDNWEYMRQRADEEGWDEYEPD